MVQIQDLIDKFQPQYGPGVNLGELGKRVVEMVETKNFEGLLKRLPHVKQNPFSRAVFERVTGIRLPDTASGTEEALRQWIGPDITRAYDEAQEAARVQRERESIINRVKNNRVIFENRGVMTAKEYIDYLINQHFNILRKGKRGAVTRWELWHTDDKTFYVLNVSRGEVAYAQLVLKEMGLWQS